MSQALDAPLVLAVVSTALITCLVLAAMLRKKVAALEALNERQRREFDEKLEHAVRQATEDERTRSGSELLQAEQRFEKSLEEQRSNALSVVVHPFVNTEGKKGIFTRETKVEIGYKYQLFVQGLPCFEPHTMVLESTTHKEVDEQMIQLLKNKAVQAAEAAVLVKSGGTAKTVITIAKTALKLAR